MTQPEALETRRKRLLWRASHRGLREMDLLLGGFARSHIERLSEHELDELETIIAIPDQELLDWLLGDVPVPQGQATPTLKALLSYRP
jgi:antitoxin CptB